MTDVTQTVSFGTDISVNVSAKMVQDDYGVPGSPIFYTDTDHDWADDTIEIFGVDVKIKELPEALRNAIWDEAVQMTDFDKWENCE